MDDYLENDNKGSPAVFSTIMKKKINIPYVYEPQFEVQNGRQQVTSRGYVSRQSVFPKSIPEAPQDSNNTMGEIHQSIRALPALQVPCQRGESRMNHRIREEDPD